MERFFSRFSDEIDFLFIINSKFYFILVFVGMFKNIYVE